MTINRLCGSVLLFSLLISHVPDRSLLSLYNEEDTKVSHFPKVSQPSSLHHMILLTSQGVMNYETVFPRNVSSWIRFFSPFFLFLFLFFWWRQTQVSYQCRRRTGCSDTLNQIPVLYHSITSQCQNASCHNAPRTPEAPSWVLFFFINIEVLFIATVAVSGGQCSEKSCSGRWLSGVE